MERWPESGRPWYSDPTLGSPLDPEPNTHSPFLDGCVQSPLTVLMGGKGRVSYEAAEFSGGSDFAILAEAEDLERLSGALAELWAGVIALSPAEFAFLEKGRAIHFRCRHPECHGLRVAVV
jgi:hypothetical protein